MPEEILGRAKRVKLRTPFQRSREAWEWEGRKFVGHGVGAIYVDEKTGTLLDLKTGCVYTGCVYRIIKTPEVPE